MKVRVIDKVIVLLAFMAIAPLAGGFELGINLAEVNTGTSEQPFLNIVKTGNGWLPQKAGVWNTGEAANIPMDDNGYPLRIDGAGADGQTVAYTYLSVLLVRNLPAPFYPAGNYVVLWDGEGSLKYSLDAKLVSHAVGRDVVKATPTTQGILVSLTATNPQNPLRNLRVVHESQEQALANGIVFNPEFLAKVAPFRGFRFMDWMRTNDSTQASWQGRPKVGDVFWGTPKGVPVEVMTALMNETGKAGWFNMPHQADDAYIDAFAEAVKTQLTGNQVVYVEYTNESWNSLFGQYDWVQAKGKELWPSTTETAFTLGRNYHGMRTAQLCDAWKTIWGSKAWRVNCVLGGWATQNATNEIALKCALWDGKPCDRNHGIDALGIAPYFGYPVPSATTLDALFAEITNGGQIATGYPGGMVRKAHDNAVSQKALADRYGLALIGYEGGQHLLEQNNTTLTDLYMAANRDTRMGAVYSDYLAGIEASGMTGLYLFNDAGKYSKYGSWGLLETILQPASPKYDAAVGFGAH